MMLNSHTNPLLSGYLPFPLAVLQESGQFLAALLENSSGYLHEFELALELSRTTPTAELQLLSSCPILPR